MKSLVNLEIVRGCKNVGCSCFGTTCPQDGGISYMSEITLSKLLERNGQLSQVELHDNAIYLYGLGETLEHPNLAKMIGMVRGWRNPQIIVNSDGHYFEGKTPSIVSEKTAGIDHLVICHKENRGFLTDENISALSPKVCVHLFLLKKATNEKLIEIDSYIDKIMNKRPDDGFRLAQMWESSFENGLPDESRPAQTFLFGVESLPLTKSGEGDEPRAPRRVYVTYQGMFRTCLFAENTDEYRHISDVLETTKCQSCRLSGEIYALDVRKEVK